MADTFTGYHQLQETEGNLDEHLTPPCFRDVILLNTAHWKDSSKPVSLNL